MKLTGKQKKILDDCMIEFSVVDIISEFSTNAFILTCLRAIKDYDELEDDVRSYCRKKVEVWEFSQI